MNKNIEKNLLRNIKLDYIGTFLSNLNMQSSIWVLYLAFCGLNLAEIGVLEGIYHFTSVVCEIPSGVVADLLGRKRSMILSRVCAAISCILMLLSESFWLFALSFIIQAMGNNFNSGSEEALVYDSMKYLGQEEEYIGVCGRLNMVLEVSQGIATVAGGILAEYSWFWCYAACFIIAVLALIPVLLMREVPNEGLVEKRKASFGVTVSSHFKTSYIILKNDLRILKLMVYYAVIFAMYTLLFFYSQEYFWNLGYSKIQISVVMLFAGIFSCMGATGSAWFAGKCGKRTGMVSAAVIALSLACFGVERPVLSVTVFVFAGFFNSVLYPVKSETINSLIPSGQRATLISVESMFFSVAMIILFPLAGKLAECLRLPIVLALCGISLLLFAGIWELCEKNVN
ncbi:MAG: MFS transporter [Roseburia sp.]|nr:MFS transporter [Roseburia sp.]